MDNMTRYPLSREHASAVCNEFKYLTGKPLNVDIVDTTTIECVAVAPFDDVNKYIFLTEYRSVSDPEKAMGLYGGTLFDVILIAHPEHGKGDHVYKDLNVYLAERNIPFNPLKYG